MADTSKNKKLYKGSFIIQAAGLYWCVLILIFGLNGLMLYRFAIRQETLYFMQEAEYNVEETVQTIEALMPTNWLFDYWSKHPEAPSDAERSGLEAYQDVYDSLERKYGEPWEFSVPESDLKTLGPREQEAIAGFYYYEIKFYTSLAKEESRDVLEGPIIAGGRPEEPPRVILCASEDYPYKAGETLNISGKDLEQVSSTSYSDISATDTKLPTIRIADEPGGNVKTLGGVACRIATGDDTVMTFAMVGVDEAHLKQRVTGAIFHLIGIDLLISALLGYVFMRILYGLILRPVTRIQKGLAVYVKSGDTDEVVNTMESIQAGNEIGRLAGDIGNMVQEMEVQVRARQQLEDKQEKLDAELENAAKIQMSMLPGSFPDRSKDHRLELYASVAPAREVGGDLYDFFMIDQDRLALVIADVSGKGIPAALFMMQAKTLIREIAHQDIPIENIMERVNSGLCAYNEEQLFITTWMMILDLATGKALEVNAGHTKPALCRHEERYSMVRNAHDLPLGLMENLSFTVYEWHLKPGDRIFVYTDGISEAENISEEQFGTERLLLALNEVRNAPEKETLDFVAKSVRAFAGEAPQTDDMTMLGMTYFGETSQ